MTRRRDVERLAALLEADPADAPAVHDEDREAQAMLALAEALRDVTPAVEPMRPAFRTELRAQVVDAARAHEPASPLLTRMRDRIDRARYSTGFATGTGVAALALSGGGVAGAAELAQPGDALYGIKLGIEDVRLALTADELGRGRRAISYAEDRLDEARRAAEEGDGAAVATALRGAGDRMAAAEDAMLQTGELEPALELADAAREQRAAVDALAPLLDGEAAVAADGFLEVLEAALRAVGAVVVPGSDVPPPLPEVPATGVPTQTPAPAPGDSTATDAPDVTTPPVEGGPAAPGTGGGLPDVEGPGLPLPDLPGVPQPNLPQPGVQAPSGGVSQPSAPAPIAPLPDRAPPPAPSPVQGAGAVLDGVGDAVEQTGGAVGEAVGDVVDDVLDEVLPAPQQAPAPSPQPGGSTPGGTVGDAVDGVVGGVTGAVGGLLGG